MKRQVSKKPICRLRMLFFCAGNFFFALRLYETVSDARTILM